MDLLLRGKNALVTGGSRGIGAGICTVLAEEGCNVAINFRSDVKHAEEFAAELQRQFDVSACAIRADVSIETQAMYLYTQAKSQLGQLDILINNAAGGFRPSSLSELSEEAWHAAGRGILDPAFYMSRSFVQDHIETKRGGYIVNVLSKSAILSSSVNNLTYVVNKGALVSMTRSMAKELIPYGIYVNGIVPGYVKTEHIHQDGDARTERVRGLLPTHKFAEPKDMGVITAALCSPLFGQMIGSIVDCTGGTLI